MYLYIHIYTHTHTHINIYMYIHVYIYTCIYIYIFIFILIFIYVYMHVCVCACVCVCNNLHVCREVALMPSERVGRPASPEDANMDVDFVQLAHLLVSGGAYGLEWRLWAIDSTVIFPAARCPLQGLAHESWRCCWKGRRLLLAEHSAVISFGLRLRICFHFSVFLRRRCCQHEASLGHPARPKSIHIIPRARSPCHGIRLQANAAKTSLQPPP